MIWRVMTLFALLIATGALVISVAAYYRTGGDLKIQERVKRLQQVVQKVRQETANSLDRLETLVRGFQERQAGAEGFREK
ncbi:MAG: hypothetical protein ACE5G5_06260 [Candidatus Methylomirabilales bacterium]